MFSPPFQTLLVQARIDDLYRTARISNRRGTTPRRRPALRLPALVKRVEIVGHPSPATRSQRS
jgi:hypothetical protein